jgi:hypothetical protein
MIRCFVLKCAQKVHEHLNYIQTFGVTYYRLHGPETESQWGYEPVFLKRYEKEETRSNGN